MQIISIPALSRLLRRESRPISRSQILCGRVCPSTTHRRSIPTRTAPGNMTIAVLLPTTAETDRHLKARSITWMTDRLSIFTISYRSEMKCLTVRRQKNSSLRITMTPQAITMRTAIRERSRIVLLYPAHRCRIL